MTQKSLSSRRSKYPKEYIINNDDESGYNYQFMYELELNEAEFVHPSVMSNLSGVKNIFDVVIANRLSDDIW